MRRPETTSPAVEALEADWWRRYADLEEEYAWVQPDRVRRLLRRHYVKEILRQARPGGTIVELGCGTGWLCRDLVLAGAHSVVGFDFSDAQIAIARKRAVDAGLGKRVSYFVGGIPDAALLRALSANMVVIHAFLHHLNAHEVRTVLDAVAAALPRDDGRLVIVEPIKGERDPEQNLGGRLSRRLLYYLTRIGERKLRGMRPISAAEAAVRGRLAERQIGEWPHGPSPKEMPFAPGELDGFLQDIFSVIESKPVFAMSHTVIREWLLRRISYPVSSNLMIPLIAYLAAWGDSLLIRSTPNAKDQWTFTLFSCRGPRSLVC